MPYSDKFFRKTIAFDSKEKADRFVAIATNINYMKKISQGDLVLQLTEEYYEKLKLNRNS